jgi:hypothetical protein
MIGVHRMAAETADDTAPKIPQSQIAGGLPWG